MPGFSIEVPNPLGKEKGKERLSKFLNVVRAKYKDQVTDLQESWEGDTLHFSFKTYGFAISGDLVVDDSQARITGTLPLAAAMFRSKIEGSIREELEKQLNKPA